MTTLRILFHGFIITARNVSNTIFGTSYPIPVITIDITNKCNMRCKFCYYAKDRCEKELSDTEWEQTVKKYRKKGYRFALWAGGEPMIRAPLLKKLTKYFDLNIIYTNGSWLLAKLPNTTYFISVDGNREMYEKQRGNYYEKVIKNINEYDGKIVIDMTVNRENMVSIEEHADIWCNNSKVKGVIYDLYSPSNKEDSELVLTEDDKSFHSMLMHSSKNMESRLEKKVFWTISIMTKNTYHCITPFYYVRYSPIRKYVSLHDLYLTLVLL